VNLILTPLYADRISKTSGEPPIFPNHVTLSWILNEVEGAAKILPLYREIATSWRYRRYSSQ